MLHELPLARPLWQSSIIGTAEGMIGTTPIYSDWHAKGVSYSRSSYGEEGGGKVLSVRLTSNETNSAASMCAREEV